jgi:hypothetical protein
LLKKKRFKNVSNRERPKPHFLPAIVLALFPDPRLSAVKLEPCIQLLFETVSTHWVEQGFSPALPFANPAASAAEVTPAGVTVSLLIPELVPDLRLSALICGKNYFLFG